PYAHRSPYLFLSTPRFRRFYCLFSFNATAPTETYTLSLHDALPIFDIWHANRDERNWGVEVTGYPASDFLPERWQRIAELGRGSDRKSTRLNSSHVAISYAVFCLKKKKKKEVSR